MKALDLVGKRFGSLLVIERRGSDEKGQSLWLCCCDCGAEKVVRGHDLKGGTKSCGCSRKYNTGLYKHGLSNTRIHRIWRSIQDRCYNQNNQDYRHYGGRGITVCDEWKDDFLLFYNWALENGYNENLTIDRVDVNSGYSPENCRWVSMETQANNKRNNKVFTLNGKTLTVSQWSKETGVKYGDIQNRLNYGYSFEEAISPNFKRKFHCKTEENKRIKDLCDEKGVSYKTVYRRLKEGWTLERALTTPLQKRRKGKAAP